MDIWAFDLATRCGVAHGNPPRCLEDLDSYVVKIRNNPDEDYWQLARNFLKYLYDVLKNTRPDLIVWEAPLSVHAKFDRPQNEGALLLPHKLEDRLRDVCEDVDIPWRRSDVNVMRRTFLGQARGRIKKTAIKRAMCDQCHLWGYLPSQCWEDNRADAIGHWHYAQLKWGGWRPPGEVLFGRMVPMLELGTEDDLDSDEEEVPERVY